VTPTGSSRDFDRKARIGIGRLLETPARSAVSRVRGRSVEAGTMRKRLKRFARPARFGLVRRALPLSDAWGWDRGTPIDRYYIERFLEANSSDIRGRVLEVKDTGYTDRFGTGVTEREVLDIDPGNPRATIVADLAGEETVPASAFDCFILTQTLQHIYEVRSAVAQAYRLLKPWGVLLATVPGISPTAGAEMPWYWSFTAMSSAALFEEPFGEGSVDVRGYGNPITAIAFLAGMSCEELREEELDTHDPRFTMLLSVRAVKEGSMRGEACARQAEAAVGSAKPGHRLERPSLQHDIASR
jgi:SAM-dependent methyltransferase